MARLARLEAMTLDERSNFYWLDSIAADGISFEHLVPTLATSYEAKKLIACQELIQELATRIHSVYDVLKIMQKETQERGLVVAPKVKELLLDLVLVACSLRECFKRFSEEHLLYQLIRNERVVECLQQAHDGVDEFVREIQRLPGIGERFNDVAASFDIGVLDRSPAEWRDQVSAMSPELAAEINAHIPQENPPEEVKEKILSAFKFEKQRRVRRGTSSPLFDLVEEKLGKYTGKATLAAWYIPPDDIICEKEEIGKGGCGVAYRGWMASNTRVVIKRALEFDKEALGREITICYLLKHPHILQFYGATFLDSDCSIVSEFARHGRLDRYLAISGNKKHLWRLLYEAALGLHYMHDMGYVHGDLKCDNIFVGDDLKAKLADFGLSFKKGDHKKVRCTQAVNALSPECVIADQERSFPADVFAFGMCIVEAVYGGPAWGCALNAAARRFVKLGTLPDSVSKLAPDVQKLVKAMCAFDPLKRMTLEDVIAKLKQFADAKGDDQAHLLAGGVEKK